MPSEWCTSCPAGCEMCVLAEFLIEILTILTKHFLPAGCVDTMRTSECVSYKDEGACNENSDMYTEMEVRLEHNMPLTPSACEQTFAIGATTLVCMIPGPTA